MPEPTTSTPLRDQIEHALYSRLREQTDLSRPGAAIRAEARADDLAAAVLPAVEVATAALRQRAERAERERDIAVAAADPFKIERVKSLTAAMTRLVTTERDAARQRAEQAQQHWADEQRRCIEAERATLTAEQRAEKAEAAVQRVRDLHRPRTERRNSGCIQCGIVWPCPTLAALDQPETPSDGR